MTNKELLQSAKDEAAREWGYRNWEDVYSSFDAGDLTYQKLEIVVDDAMEIYAEKVGDAQRTEGIREGFDAARERFISDDTVYKEHGPKYHTVEQYLNSKP